MLETFFTEEVGDEAALNPKTDFGRRDLAQLADHLPVRSPARCTIQCNTGIHERPSAPASGAISSAPESVFGLIHGVHRYEPDTGHGSRGVGDFYPVFIRVICG
jgi:hypothetical protein